MSKNRDDMTPARWEAIKAYKFRPKYAGRYLSTNGAPKASNARLNAKRKAKRATSGRQVRNAIKIARRVGAL